MKYCNACGQTNKNASALCLGGRTHDYGEPPPSQLDRIEEKLDKLLAPKCTCQIQQFCAVHNPMRGFSA